MPDAECCRMSQTVAKLAGTAATKTREVLQRSKQPPATIEFLPHPLSREDWV